MHSRQQFNISRALTTQCTTSLEKLFTDSLMRMKDLFQVLWLCSKDANLEMQFSNETLHEKDSNSELRAIKGQFEHFMHSKMFELSKYNTNAREILQDFNAYTTMEAQTFKETIIQNMNSIEQCIIERASHEQELKMTLKKKRERQLQIQQCKVPRVSSSITSSGDETSRRIVSDEEIEKKKLEAHYGFMAKIQEVLPAESSSIDTPLEQVQNHDESNVFANERRHSEQPESINDTYVLEKDDSNVTPDSSNICNNDNQVDQNAAECAADERAALANLIANLTLDTEENKTILKQLKKANASLTQELKECKTNLDETSRALGEATSSRDSCLIALQTKQTELEKYTALNDLTSDYKILQTKLNETLGLLARKDIDIQEGLKTKTYEISVVNQKHDELVKKSLLTRSQFEGQLKEKTKVISDLKVKEGRDIDTMIEMDKQIKSTFANPKYLKKAQSDKPCLYEIPYDTSDPANRFCPNGEETVTLEKESRSKLDKDTEMNDDLEYVNSLEKEVDELESEKADFSNIYDLLLEEYYPTLLMVANQNIGIGKHQSSRVSNKDVHLGEHRKQKPFLKFNDLQCPTCKKCLYSANHDECVLEYLSRLNPRASAQNKDAKSHKTTKRYMPVEKSSASKKPERQISTGHRWVPTGKLLNSCTGKVENEPTHGSNVDIPHIYACKQTLGLSAADQASVFMAMTSDHNRSELGIHDHSNELSSSKLVPTVVPLANKTATSRQELELLFHLHIAMLRTTGINPMIQPEPEDLPKDNPKLEIAVL
ncbi:hypothetical protein Tco_1102241, partial [Tanacetum coccineum]